MFIVTIKNRKCAVLLNQISRKTFLFIYLQSLRKILIESWLSTDHSWILRNKQM